MGEGAAKGGGLEGLLSLGKGTNCGPIATELWLIFKRGLSSHYKILWLSNVFMFEFYIK